MGAGVGRGVGTTVASDPFDLVMPLLPFIPLEAAVGAALIVGAAVPLDPFDFVMPLLPFVALEAVVGAALMVGAAVPLDPLDIAKYRRPINAAVAEGGVQHAFQTTTRVKSNEKRVMVGLYRKLIVSCSNVVVPCSWLSVLCEALNGVQYYDSGS
jgi:hypothetical protein